MHHPHTRDLTRRIVLLLFACLALAACARSDSGTSELRLDAGPGKAAATATSQVKAPSPTQQSIGKTAAPNASNESPNTRSASASTATPITASPAVTPDATPRLAQGAGTTAAAVDAALAALRSAGHEVLRSQDRPDLRLSSTSSPGALLVYERILVPVDRFSTFLEGVSLDELRSVWRGSGASADFATIYPSEDVVGDLTAILGAPGPAVKPVPGDKVIESVWNDPMALGIVAFDKLNVRLRALHLDGLSAVDNRLDQAQWPLATRAWLSGQTAAGKEALTQLAGLKPVTNRDPSRLTVLVSTGVTAIARGSAAATEQSGDSAYVARIVGPELAAADITAINNEIPFLEGCKVNTDPDNIIFCASPAYFDALKLSGVTIIGLTGNHMNDYGTEAFSQTLKIYDQAGVYYYGGGMNAAAARAPLALEHNGNTFAFLGANQYGPEYYTAANGELVSAWAGPNSLGAARFDRDQMTGDIAGLRSKVNIVVAEMQHTEFNDAGQYQTAPIPSQMADFRALSDAGADIVVGVQAHTPQAIELRGDDRIILYGLGNLYFDQVRNWNTRPGLVARHTIYMGHLLSTEILVTVIDPNMQPRWATEEERTVVLRDVFSASGW